MKVDPWFYWFAIVCGTTIWVISVCMLVALFAEFTKGRTK